MHKFRRDECAGLGLDIDLTANGQRPDGVIRYRVCTHRKSIDVRFIRRGRIAAASRDVPRPKCRREQAQHMLCDESRRPGAFNLVRDPTPSCAYFQMTQQIIAMACAHATCLTSSRICTGS
jgi:hypothetical protein